MKGAGGYEQPGAQAHDTPRHMLGEPATYYFGGEGTPVRFLGLHKGEPIVLFDDGRIEQVARHRVRLS